MQGQRKRSGHPRISYCPGVPSVKEIEAEIAAEELIAHTARRATARQFSRPRAEFSRRFCIRLGLPPNPAALSTEDVDRIRAHPQYVDPIRCPMHERMFALECQMIAA